MSAFFSFLFSQIFFYSYYKLRIQIVLHPCVQIIFLLYFRYNPILIQPHSYYYEYHFLYIYIYIFFFCKNATHILLQFCLLLFTHSGINQISLHMPANILVVILDSQMFFFFICFERLPLLVNSPNNNKEKHLISDRILSNL